MPSACALPASAARRSVGADKGYDTADFIDACRQRRVTPHVACNDTRRGGSAIDERTTRHAGYRLSQIVRKRIEEHFGWGKSIGPNTGAVLEEILKRRQHPEQGFRSCLGVIRLKDSFPTERLERACARALKYGTLNRRSIEAILKNNLDVVTEEAEPTQLALPTHSNIRGAGYYH